MPWGIFGGERELGLWLVQSIILYCGSHCSDCFHFPQWLKPYSLSFYLLSISPGPIIAQQYKVDCRLLSLFGPQSSPYRRCISDWNSPCQLLQGWFLHSMKTLLVKLLARDSCVSVRLRLPLFSFSWQCNIVPILEMLYASFSLWRFLKWEHQSSPWRNVPNLLPSTSKIAGWGTLDRHLPEINAESWVFSLSLLRETSPGWIPETKPLNFWNTKLQLSSCPLWGAGLRPPDVGCAGQCSPSLGLNCSDYGNRNWTHTWMRYLKLPCWGPRSSQSLSVCSRLTVYFLAQSKRVQIWEFPGHQVNLCIQVKYSLKFGWGPVYKVC